MVCLRLNLDGKGVVQYKVFPSSLLRVSSTQCQCWQILPLFIPVPVFLLNCLFSWHLSLFTYIRHTVYIQPLLPRLIPLILDIHHEGPSLLTSCVDSVFNRYLLNPSMGKTYWIIGGENRLFSKIYWAQSSESLQYDLIILRCIMVIYTTHILV